ncbi:MAG: hypothetical protein ACRDFX_09715 [Chloroflexota bacterium]
MTQRARGLEFTLTAKITSDATHVRATIKVSAVSNHAESLYGYPIVCPDGYNPVIVVLDASGKVVFYPEPLGYPLPGASCPHPRELKLKRCHSVTRHFLLPRRGKWVQARIGIVKVSHHVERPSLILTRKLSIAQ